MDLVCSVESAAGPPRMTAPPSSTTHHYVGEMQPISARRRSARAWVATASLAATAFALTACSAGTPDLALGESAPLETQEPLVVDIAVTSVTASTLEESGLTGLFGASIEGVPWLVGYRLDLTSGSREDFSWEAVTDVTAQAWTADAGSAGEIVATGVHGTGAEDLPCAELGQEPPRPALGFYCQVFLLPEGATLESVTLTDVATWAQASS